MCFPMEKCCLCISLNVGAKIIAVFSLITSIITLVVYGGAAISLPTSWVQSKHYFYLITAAITVFQVVFCSLLVYGIYQHKPSYLWPWLVTSWLACAGLILLSLLGVALLTVQYYNDEETFTQITTMSTFYFAYAVILYYCCLIINSRRGQMEEEEKIVESAEKLMRRQENSGRNPKTYLV